MKSAVAYIRVSGQGQENGQGLERQRNTINAYADANGVELVETYEDVYTGTADALDRPGFSKMVTELNGVNTIIIERLDRLARSITVQEHAILWLAAHDFELLVADTGENVTKAYMDDPMKRALIQIQGVFAELEKSMLVRKLRLAREKKRAENGKCEGQKAYGEVDAEERETVRFIRRLREGRGETLRAIADNLNADHLPTRSGRPWSFSTVASIVKGRVYAGIGDKEA